MIEAAATAKVALDEVERLPIGSGRVDLFSFVKVEGARGSAGGALDYRHRISGNLSAFGRAWIGTAWSPAGRELAGEGIAGIRLAW